MHLLMSQQLWREGERMIPGKDRHGASCAKVIHGIVSGQTPARSAEPGRGQSDEECL